MKNINYMFDEILRRMIKKNIDRIYFIMIYKNDKCF